MGVDEGVMKERRHSPCDTGIRPDCPTASQFGRYIQCPGAYYYERNYGVHGVDSEYARIGREIHSVLSLQGHVDDLGLDGQGTLHGCINGLYEAVVKRLGFVRLWEHFKAYVDNPDGYNGDVTEDVYIYMERRVTREYDGYCISAQPDLVIIGGDIVLVVEYKTGWAELPIPYYNWQMRVQSVLVYDEFRGLMGKVPVFYLICVAPASYKEQYQLSVVTVDDIRLWGEQIRVTLGAIMRGKEAPRFAGEHCRYCSAMSICEVFRSYMSVVSVPEEVLRVVNYDSKQFVERALKRWDEMTPVERVNRFLMFRFIKQLIEAVELRVRQEVKSDINSYGGVITLRDGARRREIKDLDGLISALGYRYEDIRDIISVKLKDLQEKWIRGIKSTPEGGSRTIKSLQEEFNERIKDYVEYKETEPVLHVDIEKVKGIMMDGSGSDDGAVQRK